MARKRKIPARKHHGIRDPLKQIEEREKKLQNVVNNPPEKGDNEKISFKFAQFKKLADDSAAGKKIKRIRSGVEDLPRCGTTVKKDKDGLGNKFRALKQLAEETDKDYLKRVNRATTESLREAEYEIKYGVNVVRNPKTGEILIKKKPKNEIDELLKQNCKTIRIKGKKKEDRSGQTIDPKTAKELIKRAIKEDEEERKLETLDREEYKRDHFKFGEIVHGPPTLALPRKATKSETVSRPGKRNLLLKELLTGETAPTVKQSGYLKQANNELTKAKMRGKRKDLPEATRMMLENERSKMIALYRSLKKSREEKT